MRVFGADHISRVLTYPALIDALADAFRSDITVPPRHHHTIPQVGAENATLLIMPAWTQAEAAENRFVGCKAATIFPANARIGKPSLHGTYILMSGQTGEPLAIMDGRTLTAWRTAAASALAARYLAREDATHLLMVGAGELAPHLVRAHSVVRPINRVTLWNRTRSRAVATAFALSAAGIDVAITEDLQAAVAEADIVCCATLATEPLIKGTWLAKGIHLDLVGAFTPKMREADSATLQRARVYVDTRAGALKEAGDLVQAIKAKAITAKDVQGDLIELCRGTVKGRRKASEITVFKSVGSAIEDLAAAALVWSLCRDG